MCGGVLREDPCVATRKGNDSYRLAKVVGGEGESGRKADGHI